MPHRVFFSALALLAACLRLAGCGSGEESTPSGNATPPNIVLITVDTLRADHLGCYGYALPTSPRIDLLASRGVRFRRCYAPSSWTVPSMISLVTGVSPAVHGIVHGDIVSELAPASGEEVVVKKSVVYQELLSDSWTTLAEALRGRGYTTAGFSTNGHLIHAQGYSQGFDTFDESCIWRSADCVNQRVLAWLDSEAPRRPFFLWVHYFDPHHDTSRPDRRYDPPAPYDAFFGAEGPPLGVARSVALYDGEIRYTDEAIGALLDRLRDVTRGAPTTIVFTSDHGEEFLERGNWYHTKTVYDELVRVPLIIVLPEDEGEGRTVDTYVGLLDLMPTLLEMAGVPPVAGVEGFSLHPLLSRNVPAGVFPRRFLYAETRRWATLDRRCWVEDGKKLMVDLKSGVRTLYDLERDPGERTDLARSDPRTADSMLARMHGYLESSSAVARPVPRKLEEDSQRIEKLRSLGYLE